MRLRLAVAASLASLLTVAAPRTAFAHGGQYRGPAGEVPPDSRQPEDPPPPETGGTTPTPPDGGSTPTPPDGGSTPTPPDGGSTPEPGAGSGGGTPQPPSPGGPGGTRTAPRKRPTSFDSWIFWWSFNKDGILDLKRRLRADGAASGDGLGLSGLAEGADNAAGAQDVTAGTLERRVVPLLKEYARNPRIHFDIRASAVLGLAKMGRREEAPLMMEMAANEADRYHEIVEETAALALGVLQDRGPGVRRFLQQVASDPTARVRTRSFAMYSLGLLGERDAAVGSQSEAFATLKAVASDPAETNRDVACAALTAIGLLGDRAAVPELLRWLEEGKAGAKRLPDMELSCAAAALGRIGQPGLSGPGSDEVVTALATQLRLRNRITRYSAVIALGQVAPQGDEKVQKLCVGILTRVLGGENRADAQSANFALIALGRIAGAPSGATAARGRAVDVLAREFLEGRRGQARSFAALGLGLAAPGLPPGERGSLSERMANVFAGTSGDLEQKGAMALALGMLGDVRSSRVLRNLLEDEGSDKPLRGAAAVALGLLGDRAAVEPVRKVLREKDDEVLRIDAAVAAGLLGDEQAVGILVEMLQEENVSQYVLGSAAQALGRIGDRRAVEPLARILEGGKAPHHDLIRALAAVALGQIGDRADVPVLSRISEDVNYRAYYDALGEVLSIL